MHPPLFIRLQRFIVYPNLGVVDQPYSVFFVFYDILLLADFFVCLYYLASRRYHLFFYHPVSIEAITMLGPR